MERNGALGEDTKYMVIYFLHSMDFFFYRVCLSVCLGFACVACIL